MGRVFNKIYAYILIILAFSSCCLALDSEYKNSLSKVELVKTGDSSYNVNLYTQKAYGQSPKVIKKSDYNYYILLPETKDSKATAAYSTSSDIKNVSTNHYSYAGQDINNGYTKINITTQKPVTFNLNVKSAGAKTASSQQNTPVKTAQNQTTAQQTQEKKTSSASLPKSPQAQEVKIKQKIENTKVASTATPKKTQTSPVSTVQPQKSQQKTQNKSLVQNPQTAQNSSVKQKTQTTTQQASRVQSKTSQKQTQTSKTVATAKKLQTTPSKTNTVKQVAAPKKVEPQKPVTVERVTQNVTNPIEDVSKDVKNEVEKTTVADENAANNTMSDESQTTYSKGDIFVPMANNADIQDDEMFQDNYDEDKLKAQNSFLYKLKNKILSLSGGDSLNQGTFGFSSIIIIVVAVLICIMIFKSITKKQTQTKLKNKSEFAKPNKKQKIKPQRKVTVGDGEHFVLDSNMQQNIKEISYGTSNSARPQISQSQYTTQSGKSYRLQDAKALSEAQRQIETMPAINKNVKPKMSDEEVAKQTMQNLGLDENALELYTPQNVENNKVQKTMVASPAEIKKVADNVANSKPTVVQKTSVQTPNKPVGQKQVANSVPSQQQAQNEVQNQAPKKNYKLRISEVAKAQAEMRMKQQGIYAQKDEPAPEQNEEIISKDEIKEQVKLEVEKEVRKEMQQIEADSAPLNDNIETEEDLLQEPIILQEDKSMPQFPGLKVLSSVEIAPERGFMCVSYEDSISLIGYIFDDVYALYNFKTSKLKSYDIRFRLSQRDTKGAFFIVKVDNTKLLIKVTRLAMNLEVVM